MKNLVHDLTEMRSYLLLWLTQLVSGLGSAMTAYALVIWSYTQASSALSDRWDKKKTMLVCDALAALSISGSWKNKYTDAECKFCVLFLKRALVEFFQVRCYNIPIRIQKEGLFP